MSREHGMKWLEKRTKELFGAAAAEALTILTAELRGVPRESMQRIREEMLWLANGDIAALRKLQEGANGDWRDIAGEFQAETNLERFRVPPKRNWTL